MDTVRRGVTPPPFVRRSTEAEDAVVPDYWVMVYTVEELNKGWQVVARNVSARSDYQAVIAASRRPGMYRTAAPIEPARHYFWCPQRGRLEAMDH
jgi:hypothetical protein